MKSRTSTIVAALSVVLAVQVCVTAAAIGSSGTSASEALRGKVRIHLDGTRLGPHRASGRFTLSGAISDRGEFSEYVSSVRVAPEAWRMTAVRSLIGTRGTIWTRAEWTQGHVLSWRRAHAWEVTKGSRAYAGISGGGQEIRHLPPPPAPPDIGHVDISMRGNVLVPASGSRLAGNAGSWRIVMHP
jgi:hypothetical protein